MPTNKQLFRQTAIDQLSSPEQLDTAVEVTTSRAWLALSAVWLLLFTAIIWGFVGELSTTVNGVGILIKTGGLADVATTTSGQIVRIHVSRGDTVKEGAVVAQIDQPQLVEEVAAARSRLEELRADHEQLMQFGGEGQKLESDVAAQRRASLGAELRAARERRTWLKDKVEARKRLFEEGLITRSALQTTIIESQSAEDNIARLQGELKRLQLDDLTSSKQRDSELRKGEFSIREAERRLGFLEEQLALSTQVISPHTGRVLELRAQAGDIVADGTPLMSIELANDDDQSLEALIYIPSSEGKKVISGMPARIAPSVARPEEHGMVLGKVTSVAEFPATATGMMRVLDNQELVKNLLHATAGAPLAVRAQLEPSDASPSGYRWTSGEGPDLKLTSGTPCNVAVTTQVQRPITLVVPALRHWLGM